MTGPVFVDTNVFIYALDAADLDKQRAARAWRAWLWRTRQGRVSYQVLQEFYVRVTQKAPAAKAAARSEVRDLLAWRPIPVNAQLLDRGFAVQDRYRLSFWDALIAAAAQIGRCRFLLTEDLQHGQDLGGVIVASPFRVEPPSLA
jgi:predicted nucleic acid-binding protein